MKCRECREKIPDNVKYCPECGALVNEHGGSYRNMNGSDSENYENSEKRRTDYLPHIPFHEFPHSKRKPSRSPVLIVALVVIFICFAASALSSVFYNVADWGSSVVVDIDDDLNYAENVAFDYVSNIVDSESLQSTDTFRTQSLIEWELVCRDFYRNHHDEHSVVSAVNEDDCYAFAENCLHESFEKINGRFPDDFEPYHFYVQQQEISVVSYAEAQFYHNLISSYLAGIGLEAEDYYYPDQINNLYRVQFYVTAENEECNELQDFGTVDIIAAEIYGEYYILYDDAYINSILETIN